MRFGLDVNLMRLFNGRLSVYLCVNLGRRRLWLQRWDAERQPRGLYEPSGAMTWAAGWGG
jgi:hypothetical protein